MLLLLLYYGDITTIAHEGGREYKMLVAIKLKGYRIVELVQRDFVTGKYVPYFVLQLNGGTCARIRKETVDDKNELFKNWHARMAMHGHKEI